MRRTLENIDGLTLAGNARYLPHPCDLARWTEAGWLAIDVASGPTRFALTNEGREEVRRRQAVKQAA